MMSPCIYPSFARHLIKSLIASLLRNRPQFFIFHTALPTQRPCKDWGFSLRRSKRRDAYAPEPQTFPGMCYRRRRCDVAAASRRFSRPHRVGICSPRVPTRNAVERLGLWRVGSAPPPRSRRPQSAKTSRPCGLSDSLVMSPQLTSSGPHRSTQHDRPHSNITVAPGIE